MKIEYKFIAYGNTHYKEAVALRIALFFNNMPNALSLINDSEEEKSIFLVALKNDSLVGVGRLTIDGEIGVISQMAVEPKEQGKGIGKEISTVFVHTCKELKLKKVVLSARKTAIAFYENVGFIPEKDFYASKKTGVLHKNMSLQL